MSVVDAPMADCARAYPPYDATQHSGNAWHDAVSPLALEQVVHALPKVGTTRLQLVRLALLVAPLGVVAGWYFALPGHTMLHQNFMVRLVVWLPLTGWVLCVLAVMLRPGGVYSAGTGPATILTRLPRESRSIAR